MRFSCDVFIQRVDKCLFGTVKKKRVHISILPMPMPMQFLANKDFFGSPYSCTLPSRIVGGSGHFLTFLVLSQYHFLDGQVDDLSLGWAKKYLFRRWIKICQFVKFSHRFSGKISKSFSIPFFQVGKFDTVLFSLSSRWANQ